MSRFYKRMAALSMIAGVAASSVYAAEEGEKFKDGEINYQILSVGRATCAVIKPTGYNAKYKGDVIIPSTVSYEEKEYRVVAVNKDAFNGSECTSVTLPSSVKIIRESSFYSSRKLTSVTLPEGLDSIAERSFGRCDLLPSVSIPASVRFIGNRVFEDCAALTEFSVAEGSKRFSGHDGMLFTAEGDTLLYYGGGLTATVFTVPEGVTTVGPYAFYGNKKFTEISIPASVRELMTSAFDNNTNLKTINIAEGLEILGENAFQSSAITQIGLPESLRIICGNAFMRTSNLTSIVIPDRVDSIGTYALYNNSSLTDVTIGRNVANMAQTVFGRSDKITNVVSLNPVPPVCNGVQFSTTAYSKGTLKVPRGSMEAYKASAGFKDFATVTEFEAATSMTLDKSAITIDKGETAVLKAVMMPAEAYQYAGWTSSAPEIAAVDNLGRIMALSEGKATVTASTFDGSGIVKICEVTVKDVNVGIDVADTDVAFSVQEDFLTVGEAFTVYSVSGLKVAESDGPASVRLASGLYIVRTGTRVAKIRI